MIVWIGFIGAIYNFKKNKEKQFVSSCETDMVPKSVAILIFGYIIFWAGIRSGVADTAAYIASFNNYPSSLSGISNILSSESKAVGFDLISVAIKSLISSNYHVWLMLIAIFTGIPIMLTLRKHSENFIYSAFLFVVTLNFFWMFNGIRQFLVAGILFALSDWIIERKTIPFIIVVLLLSTIHFTAIIMIPIYFFVTDKPFGNRMILFLCVLIACLIFLDPFLNTLDDLLIGTGYSGFQEQFAEDDGVNPVRVIVMIVPVIIAFLGRGQIEDENNMFINLCVNMSIITAGLYFIGLFTSGILIGRLPIYFELYNLILLPYLIRHCFTKESSVIMYGCCTIGYIAYYYLQMQNSLYISDLTGLIT
jgi:hypothetical protein